MAMYRHILIPTDGSNLSQQAVAHAVELAEAIKARITLVTVTQPFHIVSLEAMQIEESQDSYDRHMVERARAILTGAQVRIATAALKLRVRELATQANISPTTLTKIEADGQVNASTLVALRHAVEAAGVQFIPENGGGAGVRLARAGGLDGGG